MIAYPSNSNGVGVNTPDPNGAPGPNIGSSFFMTDGWYMAIAVATGILTANTRVGPAVFGILSIALIYQLTLTLEGK
jgi:hypothetical protein